MRAGAGSKILKRGFDLLVASLALAVLSPVWLTVAAAVKLTSAGPVFYRDARAGRGGRPFSMLKFRTMIVGAENVGLGREVAADDPRITRVGHFLRRWSLDEIPQLFNVLAGHMSIVGPRAATPAQMARCSDLQRRRLEVRPGMAGWAWIHGRNAIPWSKRIELDIWYVENWTFPLDLQILIKAAVVLLRREGIYGADGVARDLDVASDAANEV